MASGSDSVGTLSEELIPTGWERMEVMDPRAGQREQSLFGLWALKV